MTTEQIEEILRRKYYNENLLKYHAETAVTTLITGMPGAHSGESKVEKKIVAKLTAEYELLVVRITLNLCSQEQTDFVKLRYFQGHGIEEMQDLMCISRPTLYRMRDNILSQALRIVNFGDEEIQEEM
jgi:hypothetical protein